VPHFLYPFIGLGEPMLIPQLHYYD
jgi:hypothetical protein